MGALEARPEGVASAPPADLPGECLFGAPVAYEDHAARACLDVVGRFDEVGEVGHHVGEGQRRGDLCAAARVGHGHDLRPELERLLHEHVDGRPDAERDHLVTARPVACVRGGRIPSKDEHGSRLHFGPRGSSGRFWRVLVRGRRFGAGRGRIAGSRG